MSITFARPEKTVTLCTKLDLQAQHELAVDALTQAQREQARDGRENDSSVRDAAAEVQRIEAEMRAHELVFTLRAWPRKRWAEFEEANPPRAGRDDDKTFGLAVPALDDALAGSGDWPRTIVAVTDRDGAPVDFDPRSEWVALADQMTDAQWNAFAVAVLNVNRGVTAAPFSPLASAVTRRSEQSSKRPSA